MPKTARVPKLARSPESAKDLAMRISGLIWYNRCLTDPIDHYDELGQRIASQANAGGNWRTYVTSIRSILVRDDVIKLVEQWLGGQG